MLESNLLILLSLLETLNCWDRERWQALAIETKRRGLVPVNPYLVSQAEANYYRQAIERRLAQ